MVQLTKNLPSGSSCTVLDACGSTSKDAIKLYSEGQKAPFWVLTKKQTTGYGRRGRAWQMQEGDFAGSLIYQPDARMQSLGEFSFIMALAVFGALERLSKDTQLAAQTIKLKWPNDILINNRKVCGILLELIKKEKITALCIGIGINIVSHPEDTPYPASCLSLHGLTPDIFTLLREIDDQFYLWVDMWQQRGFNPIRTVWCEHAAGIGEETTVNLPSTKITGIFEDIDDEGRLILVNKEKTHVISAGDVFFS